MIFCLGTTPAVQRVMIFRRVILDAVNRASTTVEGAAGKSVNVAKVLRALGEAPVAAGFFGGDRGRLVRGILESKGVELDFVETAAQTRQCITVIDEESGAHTELVEEAQPVPPEDYALLEAIIRRRIPACRAAVMSGSLTPGGPVDLYYRCAELARKAGVLSVLDAQGAPLIEALRARPGLIKPNRAELAATAQRQLDDDRAVFGAMRELHERGADQVVVTSGRNPALAFDGARCWRISPPSITTVNPIGSGDAFTAGLVMRLLRGDDLGEACRWAAAAGSANALTVMAGEVQSASVERLVGHVRVEPVPAA